MTAPRCDRDRAEITALYSRVCKDSDHTIEPVKAAILTANILGIHPLEVWLGIGFAVMQKLSKRDHDL